jgi:hypothetical protein
MARSLPRCGRDFIRLPLNPLNAAGILEVFNRHGVEYVVIGAFAAIAQQAPIPATRDIDLTPGTSDGNLARLSAALHELGARIRAAGVTEGLPFDHDGASLGRARVWNLICMHGELDLSFFPSGFDRGYEQLALRAHRVAVSGTVVVIADLDDVIKSKEAAGRPKDLQVLPILYRHQQSFNSDDAKSQLEDLTNSQPPTGFEPVPAP